jgi:hypothetical protein
MSGSESQVEQQVDRIGEVLGVAILDNYEGFVCMGSTADGGTPTLSVGQTYSLIMWFQPDQPEQASSGQGYALAEQILIEGGMDTSEVEFSLTPDSDGFSFRPREKQVAVPVTDTSPQAEFQFLAPEDAAPYELWVEVFQKNRLIHVISARLYVEAREGG